MLLGRAVFASALSLSLISFPAWGAPTAPLGTVIAADRANVGEAKAEAGTTIYGGDSLTTQVQGSVQIRAGAARLLLLSSSNAVVNSSGGAPSANLLRGAATFSTGNARAFTMFASTASIRPQSDAPTIGQVSYIGPKELLVHAKRGALVVTVDADTQIIPEGTAYRVMLDQPEEMGQGPAGAGAPGPRGRGGTPLRAGRSRFLIGTVALTGVVTYLAVSEALESPARP
jgi:hypothetical protein